MQIDTWEREHCAEGGEDPFLLYVVYGNIDTSVTLARDTYRSNGIPDGLDLMSYGPGRHSQTVNSFREGYLWDEFVKNDPACAELVANCQTCLVLRGTPADATTLNYLRDVVGLLTFLLDHGGCAVYDPFMFQWWNPATWRARVFDPAGPVPRHHTVILVSEDERPDCKWYHTRGMRKFGRPDISVRGVTPAYEEGVIDLCNRLIEYQAFGAVISHGQEVRMASLPPGGVMRHRGDVDDPDFNNIHIDISWPTGRVA